MLARHLTFLILACFLLPALSPAAHAGGTGLPLPRFASLRPDEVNVRTGPGTRYPIEWVYRRAGLPVEIIEEFDVWRKIRDIEGGTGWVHKSMLAGARTAMIKDKKPCLVRLDPDPKSRPLLKAEGMVIARLVECQKDWCRIQLSGRKGWVEKKYLWGVYPGEVFD